MRGMSRKVAIVGGVRTPFVKSMTHYVKVSNLELATAALKTLVERFHLQGQSVGEVVLGSVMLRPEDWNLAREAVLGTWLRSDTPAYNIQRACGTSLEGAAQLALKIAAGQIESGIAGGSDTNSDVPISFSREFARALIEFKGAKGALAKARALSRLRAEDLTPRVPNVVEPRTHLSMGQHCEVMVKEWKISRAAQDELAFASHQAAARAYEEGFYRDLVFEFMGLSRDGILRADTEVGKLAKLAPVFDKSAQGTLTAGNSTPLTDGAAVVLLASEAWAAQHKLPVQAYFIDAESAAVDFVGGEGLLMAPTIAVHRLLQRNGLTLQDFDFYEIHEAFAGQVLCTLTAWESDDYCRTRMQAEKALGPIDRARMNVKGGSLALGHPFAATGARILAGLAKTLETSGRKGRGLISVCTAGGMGVAAIIERP